MEAFVVLVGAVNLPGDAGHELGHDDEVDDQWACEQGVFAYVEDADGLYTS